jgi:hypothetical protein
MLNFVNLEFLWPKQLATDGISLCKDFLHIMNLGGSFVRQAFCSCRRSLDFQVIVFNFILISLLNK